MDLEVGVPETECLLHLEPLARRTVVALVDPPVDRHPLVEVVRVEHRVIDALGRCLDLDRRRDQRHLAATSSISSHSRSARSTAASNPCNLTLNASAASAWRGSRSCSSDSISGPMKPGSSPATAAPTTDASGVSVRLSASD